MNKPLRDIVQRAETWPEEAQEKLLRAARDIELEFRGRHSQSPSPPNSAARERAWQITINAVSQVRDLEPNPNEDPTAKEEAIAEMVEEYRRGRNA
jgi:hypothetical protein